MIIIGSGLVTNYNGCLRPKLHHLHHYRLQSSENTENYILYTVVHNRHDPTTCRPEKQQYKKYYDLAYLPVHH